MKVTLLFTKKDKQNYYSNKIMIKNRKRLFY